MDYALLSVNVAIIGAIFIFFAVASQSSSSSILKYQNSDCAFGYNLSSEESQIAVIIAGGILIIPFSLSSVFILIHLKQIALLLTLIGFCLMMLAATITTISLACRIPYDFLLIVMLIPALIVVVTAICVFKYSEKLQKRLLKFNLHSKHL
jgi:hypothetical protein